MENPNKRNYGDLTIETIAPALSHLVRAHEEIVKFRLSKEWDRCVFELANRIHDLVRQLSSSEAILYKCDKKGHIFTEYKTSDGFIIKHCMGCCYLTILDNEDIKKDGNITKT